VTKKRPSSIDWGQEFADVLETVTFLFLGVLFFGGILLVRGTVWPQLRELIHYRWFAMFGTTAVFVVGLGLFLIKKRYQRLYGLAEIGFGLSLSWSIMKSPEAVGSMASWVAVIATAYLVVRGLSNYAEGRKARLEKY